MVRLSTGDKPAFAKAAVDKAAKSLLDRMGAEDVAADAPKAGDWVSLLCCCTTLPCLQTWGSMLPCLYHSLRLHVEFDLIEVGLTLSGPLLCYV